MPLNKIFILFFAVLFAISSCSKLDRSKNKGNWGSGSWNEGFTCTSFEFKNKKTQKSAKFQWIKFYPVALDKKTDFYKIGFVFELTTGDKSKFTIPEELKNIVYRTTIDGQFYIPYRYFNNINYVNPQNDYKSLVGTLTNDLGEEFSFDFNLPFTYTLWYINDDEAQAILRLIFTRSVAERDIIKGEKLKIESEVIKINTNAKSLSESQKGFVEYNKAQEDKKKNLESIKKEQAQVQTKLTESIAKVDNMTKALEILKQEKTLIEQSLTKIELNRIDTEKLLKEKALDETTIKQKITELNGLITASKELLEKTYSLLNEKAPERRNEIEDVKKLIQVTPIVSETVSQALKIRSS